MSPSSDYNLSVLVIDDHANVSKLVDAYLAKANMPDGLIDHASSLEIAIQKILAHEPKAVLLDNLLPPDFDFRVSLKALREVYAGPVILFSGEIPENIGQYEIDNSLAGVISKDEIGSEAFSNLIRKFL